MNLTELLINLEVNTEKLDADFGQKVSDRVGSKAWMDAGHMQEIIIMMARIHISSFDPDVGKEKYKAFDNLLKLLMEAVATDPWWNSRIGWFMWWCACYAKYDSYYPMQWCHHYDPLNFYREGEPVRPANMINPPKDDPFNIKGECWVHPEWYKWREEDEQQKSTS